MQDFTDKTAVVTGGASGIGKGIAARLLHAGARVVIADVNADRLDEATAELRALGRVIPHVTDVSDAASVTSLAERTVQEFGGVDLLFNNAGVGGYMRFTNINLETWDWMIGVNLMGVVHGIHAFLPHLRESKEAHVINTASISGVVHGTFLSPYVAAKAGVVGLTETLSKEFADEHPNISFSVVLPGPVNTRINESDSLAPAGVPSFDEADPSLQGLRRDRAENKLRSMSHEQAGEIILDGVRNRLLHIFTDQQHRERFEQRAAQILDDWAKTPTFAL